jgi:hypothetical protein
MSLSRRGLVVLTLVLTSRPPDRLTAQVSWNARLGATYTTAMVTDQIAGSTVTLRPTISPALIGEALIPLRTRSPLQGSAELQIATGTLQSHQGSSTTRVAGMRTFALTAGVRGRFIAPLQWRAGIGFVSYLTSEKAGVFQAGVPLRPAGTGALSYERALTPGLHLTGLLRYDVHGFTTKQLQMNGFTGSQTVHRVTLSVGVGR